MTAIMEIDAIIEAIGSLSVADQWRVVEQTQKGLKKAQKAPKAKRSAKSAGESDSEPKEKKEGETPAEEEEAQPLVK